MIEPKVGDERLDAPRGRAEPSFPNPEPRPPNAGPSDEPPPLAGSWGALYAVVLGTLAALIVLFYVFTRAFE